MGLFFVGTEKGAAAGLAIMRDIEWNGPTARGRSLKAPLAVARGSAGAKRYRAATAKAVFATGEYDSF